MDAKQGARPPLPTQQQRAPELGVRLGLVQLGAIVLGELGDLRKERRERRSSSVQQRDPTRAPICFCCPLSSQAHLAALRRAAPGVVLRRTVERQHRVTRRAGAKQARSRARQTKKDGLASCNALLRSGRRLIIAGRGDRQALYGSAMRGDRAFLCLEAKRAKKETVEMASMSRLKLARSGGRRPTHPGMRVATSSHNMAPA